MPHPKKGESKKDFIGRCMSFPDMKKYDNDQRAAICYSYWNEKNEDVITEESKSQDQQQLFGMVYAYKKGDLKLDDLPKKSAEKIKKMADDISLKDAKKFASTKHKGLPEHVKESVSFKDFLIEHNKN